MYIYIVRYPCQKEIMDIDEVVNKSANESKKFHYGKDGGVLKKGHTLFFFKSLSWSTHIIQLEKYAFAALLDNSVKRKYDGEMERNCYTSLNELSN